MAEWVHAILTLILWGSFARQMSMVRWRPHTIEQRGSCAAVALFALAMTLLFPPVYLLVDRLTGVPNLSRLAANSLGMCSGWAISPVRLSALRRRDRPGLLGSGWLLLGVIVVEAILFAAARTGESVPGNFAARYAALDAILAYRVILMVYVGSVMGQLFWIGWRHRAITQSIRQGYRRVHSQMQTLGWGCGAAYALHEALFPLLTRFALALPGETHRLIQYVFLSGFVLLLLGSGFVSLGHWIAMYWAYRRLYPFWRDLRRLVPSMTNNSPLPSPGAAMGDQLAREELERRVYDRVTELQDGLLGLRRYASSPVVAHVMHICEQRALPRDEVEAIGDAAIVATALYAPGSAPTTATEQPYGARGSADFERELRHFLRVAYYYRYSRIIPQVLAL